MFSTFFQEFPPVLPRKSNYIGREMILPDARLQPTSGFFVTRTIDVVVNAEKSKRSTASRDSRALPGKASHGCSVRHRCRCRYCSRLPRKPQDRERKSRLARALLGECLPNALPFPRGLLGGWGITIPSGHRGPQWLGRSTPVPSVRTGRYWRC